MSRSRRYQRTLSLILFDIDHFKKINDSRGHVAGDAVLRQLASLVAANVRREDIFARVGGEEFAILAPEVPLDGARALAEKLRALVQRSVFRFEEIDIPVTSSFGVTCSSLSSVGSAARSLSVGGRTPSTSRKNAGRNRVM